MARGWKVGNDPLTGFLLVLEHDLVAGASAHGPHEPHAQREQHRAERAAADGCEHRTIPGVASLPIVGSRAPDGGRECRNQSG